MNKELQKRLLSSLVMIPTALFFILKGSIFFTFFLFIIFIATSYEWINLSKKIILMKFTGIIFLASIFLASFFSAFFSTFLIINIYFFKGVNFLPAIAIAFPFRVLALHWVL